jgi:hypothetical protein
MEAARAGGGGSGEGAGGCGCGPVVPLAARRPRGPPPRHRDDQRARGARLRPRAGTDEPPRDRHEGDEAAVEVERHVGQREEQREAEQAGQREAEQQHDEQLHLGPVARVQEGEGAGEQPEDVVQRDAQPEELLRVELTEELGAGRPGERVRHLHVVQQVLADLEGQPEAREAGRAVDTAGTCEESAEPVVH